MKKGIKIVGFFAVLLAFVACEKCDKPVMTDDPFVNSANRSSEEREGNGFLTRSDENNAEITGTSSNGGSGSITDPNEDEDYDGIVDPEEDEDFEGEEEGK
ncbi:MAG: hypothetical protein JNJ99_13080 [Crocinitomicaceae bacterium]|nr:hypothetical protein [Crocinitomicaceae bacterium]